jgi:membrane-associated phospholipid phosphatase
MSWKPVPTLLSVAGASSAAFALVATASSTRASAHLDRTLEPRIAFRPRSRARRLADVASPAGKWYTLATATALIGTWLATRHGRRVGGAIVATSGLAAAGLTLAFDRVIPQPPVAAGHRDEPNKPSFPSGHAFMSTATALTTAYVLTREHLVQPRVAFPIAALLPIANTTLKLGARKHWASDAAGGIVGGLAVAALCCAAYESLSDQ